MTILDEFLMEESKRQISQYEKTFEPLIENLIGNFKRQITKNPFLESYVVHLVHKDVNDNTLSHSIPYGFDTAKLYLYLHKFGAEKISASASFQNNYGGVTGVIHVTVYNFNYR